MKNLNMESALKRYNNLMYSLGYEHSSIKCTLSENTNEWNLRDMVAECDFILSTYYEVGHCNEEMRHSYNDDERKMWRSDVGKLSRFIKAYEPFIEGMICAEGHCSKYDN